MNRVWHHLALVSVLVIVGLAGCAQSSPSVSPPTQKPVEKAAPQPAEKAATKPAEKAAAKPAEKSDAGPAAKPESKEAAAKSLPATVGLATHAIGTGFNTVGNGLAKVASDHSPIKVMVKPFAGPAAWMPMFESGELQLGVLSTTDAAWAYATGPGWAKSYKSIRILAKGNSLEMPGLVVRNDSDIKKMADLRGKRVAHGYPGAPSAFPIVTSAMESAGIRWEDVKQVPAIDLTSGLRLLREGQVDATFSGSPTTAGVLETDAAIGLRALNFGDIPPEQADKASEQILANMRKLVPGSSIGRIPKAGILKADATVMLLPIYLAASSSLSPDAVYEVTKAIYQFDKELHPIDPWLRDWKQQTMFDPNQPAPYHEGAIRFWKEKGSWNNTAEANQKRLLGQ